MPSSLFWSILEKVRMNSVSITPQNLRDLMEKSFRYGNCDSDEKTLSHWEWEDFLTNLPSWIRVFVSEKQLRLIFDNYGMYTYDWAGDLPEGHPIVTWRKLKKQGFYTSYLFCDVDEFEGVFRKENNLPSLEKWIYFLENLKEIEKCEDCENFDCCCELCRWCGEYFSDCECEICEWCCESLLICDCDRCDWCGEYDCLCKRCEWCGKHNCLIKECPELANKEECLLSSSFSLMKISEPFSPVSMFTKESCCEINPNCPCLKNMDEDSE